MKADTAMFDLTRCSGAPRTTVSAPFVQRRTDRRRRAIRRLVARFGRLLEPAVARSSRRVSELPLLGAAGAILVEWAGSVGTGYLGDAPSRFAA